MTILEIIEPHENRYPTLGNYFQSLDGTQVITATKGNGDPFHAKLILLHELVEQMLTEHANISEESITAFDLTHLDLDEPGDHPEAPYRDQHYIAMVVERMVCQAAGIPWKAHAKWCEETSGTVDIALQSKTSFPASDPTQ